MYCFKENFRSIAGSESDVSFWSEPAICRFLALPEALKVDHVIFQMVSYLGAFPFPSQAPAILNYEALLKVITLLTGRYERVLKRGRLNWTAEIYRSLAVYDKTLSEKPTPGEVGGSVETGREESDGSGKGFAVDTPMAEGDLQEAEEEEEDELVLAALESLDAVDVMKHGELSNLHSSSIPYDNFRKLVELMLLIAPIQVQEHITKYSSGLTEARLSRLRGVASCILPSFTGDKSQGIPFKAFKRAIVNEVPYLFDCLKPLFELFLFDNKFDLNKRKGSQRTDDVSLENTDTASAARKSATPLLEEGEILDGPLLSQLSFFISGDKLFHRLRLLYTGGEAGFSMGSFEKHVFNWNAPSIMLISGTIIDKESTNIRERSFIDSLPSKRLPSSIELDDASRSSSTSSTSKRVVYGAYIPTAWQNTHKYCFGDPSTLLFQLAPVHDVHAASTVAKDYVYYNKPPTGAAAGLGLGTPITNSGSVLASHHSLSSPTSSTSFHSFSPLSSRSNLSLGPVSLHLDDALEFGVFTHLGSTAGGSFAPSKIPGRRNKDWQDRFTVESLEVWGCDASEDEAEKQRKRWEWEEREAEMRRKVNLGGTGDVEADRELLRMAGIIGGDNRSGGSVG